MLLTEELVLTALTADGRLVTERAREHLSAAAAAGLAAELEAVGAVSVDGRGRIVGVAATDVRHPLLRHALGHARACVGRPASSLVTRLRSRSPWLDVADSLVADGVLARSGGRLRSFGRYRPTDPAGHAVLVDRLRSVLLGAPPASPRDVVLLQLADACGVAGALLGGGDGRRRARERVAELGCTAPLSPFVRAVRRDRVAGELSPLVVIAGGS